MNDAETKSFIISCIGRGHGHPLPFSTIAAAVRLAFPHQPPSDAETKTVIRELEQDSYVSGRTDDLLGEIWLLTPKGISRAQQL